MDNVIRVQTDIATNQMDVVDLERILKELDGVEDTGCGRRLHDGHDGLQRFDPIGKVRALLDRYPNPEGFGKAILYADAVVGWSWIYFRDYDFAKNPLGFSERILPILRQNGEMMKEIEHADCVGIDFHKVGFAPYVSSCLPLQGRRRVRIAPSPRQGCLSAGPHAVQPDVLHARSVADRSGALAGWATLKYFGIEGMQAILGGILETKYYLV